MAALSSLFIRGSNPDANRGESGWCLLLDDIGGAFDFSNLSTARNRTVRGLSRSQQRALRLRCFCRSRQSQHAAGQHCLSVVLLRGRCGHLHHLSQSWRSSAAPTTRLDYYGGFDAFQSDNSLKMDEFHDDTGDSEPGLRAHRRNPASGSRTQQRCGGGNSRTPSTSTALPNAGKQSNQDIYLGASAENRTIGGWHNLVRYGMTRKREEEINFYAAGIPLTTTTDASALRTITVTIPSSGEPTATL